MQQQPVGYQLQQQLSSLTTNTCQQQIQIIQSLPNNHQVVKFITQRNYASDLASLLSQNNPRSKLVTTLTQYLISLFELHCNKLILFANLLVSGDCLLKLLASGNKVVASAANQLIKCIISNTQFNDKRKQVRFVKALETQFISSKSSYVRQKISLYFIFISTSMYYHTKNQVRDFEAKVVRIGLQDASDKVRKNMRTILQNITQLEKQNQILEKTHKKECIRSKAKNIDKFSNKENSRSKVVYSSINHSSILQENFKEEESINSSSVQHQQNVPTEQLTYENLMFYIDRIGSGVTWATVQLSFDTLLSMLNRNGLKVVGSQQLYCQVIKRLIPFLAQKRSKMFEKCCSAICQIIFEAQEGELTKVKQFLEDNSQNIIEHSLKLQKVGVILLPFLVQVNPPFFIFKMAEISTQLKSPKEKQILLDIIIKSTPLFSRFTSGKSNKKVSSITRMMCQHITICSNRDKELGYAALAVISQFKTNYHDQVITTLLCQNDKTLTKIIELAETIDEGLKISVLDYIKSLKGQRRRKIMFNNHTQNTLDDKIHQQIKAIKQQKVHSLNKLGELYLNNLQSLSPANYLSLFSLLQFLCSQDLVLQYRFFLKEIAEKVKTTFINCLVQVLRERQSPTIQAMRQHHDAFFIQILTISVKQLNFYDDEQTLRNSCKCLIQLYRQSKLVKMRSKIMEGLTALDNHTLLQQLNQKELQLVLAYQDTLSQEENSFQ